jgi:hypothetical protein
MSKTKPQEMLRDIGCEIEAAEAHLEAIRAERRRIELEGMYPGVPHESWENRGARGRYLYMIFRRGSNGSFAGPNGTRRLYVGADPVQIENARRLAANRIAFEEHLKDEHQLSAYIDRCRREMAALHQTASRWPRVDLGTIRRGPIAGSVPK